MGGKEPLKTVCFLISAGLSAELLVNMRCLRNGV